jgi:peptidoglycan/LPS O-acetylase OafA/YrhL
MSSVTPTYRRDIDGLRAVAVISVIAFHAFPKYFPGGFIGVDIFFVISGFLISNIISHSLRASEFSFVNFYARRVRRIFPALIVVLVTCMIVGSLVMFRVEYRLLGEGVATAAAFVSNLVLVQQIDYFGPAAEMTPLLHLWSLGVEEQYYLVWPLLVVLTWPFRAAPIAAVGIILVASFAANIYLVHTDLAAAFYLPVSRFWELMLGSGLSFVMMHMVSSTKPGSRYWAWLRDLYARNIDAVHEAAAWAAIVLIGSAWVFINVSQLFPGWWALLPAAGTACLIFAGPSASINRLILGHRWLVYLGLISYPLYLWHWPILVFEQLIRAKEPTYLMRFAGISAGLIFADLTYRLIEKPIRFGPSSASKTTSISVALASAGCLGLLIHFQDGFAQRIPEELRARDQELGNGQTPDDRCFLRTGVFAPECDGDRSFHGSHVLLWGDSFAWHLSSGLRALERKRRDFNLMEYTSPGCPPIFSFTSTARPNCRSINDFVARKIAELRPEKMIIAANWGEYCNQGGPSEITEAMTRETVIRLAALGVERIVVMGQFPIWEADVPRIRAARYRKSITAEPLYGMNPNRAFPERFSTELEGNRRVQRAIEGTGAIFVSPLATFCDRDGCMLAVPASDESIASDYGHLNRGASEFFVEVNAPALLGQ